MSKIARIMMFLILIVLAVVTDVMIIGINYGMVTQISYPYYLLTLYFLICMIIGVIMVARFANQSRKMYESLAPMFVRITFFSLMISKVFLISPNNNVLVNLAPALFIQVAGVIELKWTLSKLV